MLIFFILQLFQFWTSSSSDLEQIMIVAVEPDNAPSGGPSWQPSHVPAPTGTITSSMRVDGRPSTLSDMDEDLLDY
jgi:hypothetical protein